MTNGFLLGVLGVASGFSRKFNASAVVALVLLCQLHGRAQAPTGSWNQFRGNAQLTGIADTAPPATLSVKWTYDAGDAIDSSPAIADNVVYIGSAKGELLAIDLATGKLRWKYATGSSIGESSPAVNADAVFVGDLDGTVHAVNVRDGSRLWTFKTASEIKSSPTLAEDLVLIGSYDTHLYALEARTGKVRWKLQTNGPVHATPAVRDRVVYITGCDENFRGVRLSDGAVLFTIPTGAYTGASPVMDERRAYFGTFNYDVLGVDLKSRKIVWRYRNPDREFPFYSSAAIVEGRVILGGRDKAVHAIDAASGSDGRLYVLDAATGRKQWEFDAGTAVTGSPAIAAGRVVVGAGDGRIYCFG
jgi:outer membrane protein assembly factor BamB